MAYFYEITLQADQRILPGRFGRSPKSAQSRRTVLMATPHRNEQEGSRYRIPSKSRDLRNDHSGCQLRPLWAVPLCIFREICRWIAVIGSSPWTV